MTRLGAALHKEGESNLRKILDKELFLYLLDHEMKRARRYQNFLSLLLIQFSQIQVGSQENGLQTYYTELCNLLKEETRESDLLGSLGEYQLAILLPYADESAGGSAKSRLEAVIADYDFKGRGFEVVIDRISFPGNAAGMSDLIKKTSGQELS